MDEESVRYQTYSQNGDFGEVLQGPPFPFQILNVTHDHHVFQLLIVEITGSEWHHQIP
jgi:hypothetical protein